MPSLEDEEPVRWLHLVKGPSPSFQWMERVGGSFLFCRFFQNAYEQVACENTK